MGILRFSLVDPSDPGLILTSRVHSRSSVRFFIPPTNLIIISLIINNMKGSEATCAMQISFNVKTIDRWNSLVIILNNIL